MLLYNYYYYTVFVLVRNFQILVHICKYKLLVCAPDNAKQRSKEKNTLINRKISLDITDAV